MENQDNSQKKENSGCGFWSLLIWAMALYGLLAVIDSKVTNLPFFDKIKSEVTSVFIDKNEVEKVTGIDTSEVKILENEKINKNDNKGNKNINSKSADNKNLCSSCNGIGYNPGCEYCKKGYIHCKYCKGTGSDKNSGRTCLNCRGDGVVFCENCGGDYTRIKRICYRCQGRKYTKYVMNQCSACRGTGKSRCWYNLCQNGIYVCPGGTIYENHDECSICMGSNGKKHLKNCSFGESECGNCNGKGEFLDEVGI